MINSFKHYINSIEKKDTKTLSNTKRKMNKRHWKGRWYGGIGGDQNGMSTGGMGECIHAWKEITPDYEEEQEEDLKDLDNDPKKTIDTIDVPELGDEEPGLENEIQEPENPDREGIIRVVKNAHLVYKRQQENGTFQELWIYNIDTGLQDEVDIRRNILSGTDIPNKKTKTEDGSQSYDMWTIGNVQMVLIQGLPN